MYDGGRFFVMTGEHVAGTPRTVERRQGELDELYKEIFPDAEESHDHNEGKLRWIHESHECCSYASCLNTLQAVLTG